MTRVESRARGIRIPHLRWYICGLVFIATVINYLDRQVFSILAPQLQKEIGWSELEYGRIVIAFQVAYATMMLISGRIIDRIGTKLSFSIAVVDVVAGRDGACAGAIGVRLRRGPLLPGADRGRELSGSLQGRIGMVRTV